MKTYDGHRVRRAGSIASGNHPKSQLLLIFLVLLTTPILRADDLFEKEVRPVLVKHCYECHSGTKTNGGLALDTRAGWQKGGESGPAIVPGNAKDSLFVQAVRHESLEMPPPDKGEQLTDVEIDALVRWIDRGAPAPHDTVVCYRRHDGRRSEIVVGVSAAGCPQSESCNSARRASHVARNLSHFECGDVKAITVVDSNSGTSDADSSSHLRPDRTSANGRRTGRFFER